MRARLVRFAPETLSGLDGTLAELLSRAVAEVGDGREGAWTKALQEVRGRTEFELPAELLVTPYLLDFRYRRSTGIAMTRFLQGLREGKFVGTRCTGCGRVLIPPRTFCEWCFRRVDEWVEHSGEGEVATYSIAHIGTNPKVRLPRPEPIAVIWFEGTKVIRPNSSTVAHAAGILHRLGEVEPSEIEIGMKVRPVWKPKEERTGSITDVLYFAPLRG
ncbi:MAG: Zn-ribbon domain-containing OB-fold protein [Nitrososphaerota archaeon]